MDELELRSLRFRRERQAAWEALEALLDKAEHRSLRGLSREDMLAMPGLYRTVLSSLSTARATSLDQGLIAYLESLSTRAYFFVYGPRTTLANSIVRFFTSTWPEAVRLLWRETIAAILVLAAGAVAAYYLVAHDPAFYYSFVPPELAGGRDPSANAESLRETLGHDGPADAQLATFATALFTHNARVAIFAFALGVAFCAPSAALIAYNGATLGAMYFVFDSRGLGFEFAGWLSVHGVTELLAIVLAGAAGLKIGWAVAFPGHLTRMQAAERAGRQGGVVMIGVVLMLLLAGLLEGFARQLVTADLQRYAIGIVTGLFWLFYFYWPRRRV